jgi:threonine aldolase
LKEDHANAALLARGLAEVPGIDLDPDDVDTNIVIFDVDGTGMNAVEFIARMKDEHDVLFSPLMDATSVRAVTHLDVSRADVEAAVAAVRRLLVR